MKTAVLGKTKRDTIFHKLALLSEVRSDGYQAAACYKFGEELEYIQSLEGKSNDELKRERMQLEAELHTL